MESFEKILTHIKNSRISLFPKNNRISYFNLFNLIDHHTEDYFSEDENYGYQYTLTFDNDDEFNKLIASLDFLKDGKIINDYEVMNFKKYERELVDTSYDGEPHSRNVSLIDVNINIKIIKSKSLIFDFLNFISISYKKDFFGEKLQIKKITRAIIEKYDFFNNENIVLNFYEEYGIREDNKYISDNDLMHLDPYSCFKILEKTGVLKIDNVKYEINRDKDFFFLKEVCFKIQDLKKIKELAEQNDNKDSSEIKEINIDPFVYKYNKDACSGRFILKNFGEYIDFTKRRGLIFLFFYKNRDENKSFDYKEVNKFLKDNGAEEITSDGLNKDIKKFNDMISSLTDNELTEIITKGKEKNTKEADINVYKFNNLK